MGFFQKAAGILGMNARNLHYIARYNSYASKKFADDKIFTKRFLESRGIGAAKLYHVVNTYTQLNPEFFAALPDSFVIKPNRGFGGGGILVIVRKQGQLWITASGKKLDVEFLYRHCTAILDGKYSISGVHDAVLFEERLEPHPDFRRLTEVGLPDIRLIVFNNVPVLAMARIPTYESEGKANMELGAVALGIDIGTGKSTGGAKYSDYVRKMPNGHPTAGFQIPYWDDILHAGAKIQAVTNIGFLGVDLVVTKTGIKVLEMNARAGLKIQVANKIPLKRRLEKVKDLKVLTPEDGVNVAKTLFTQKSSNDDFLPVKPVVGIRETVIMNADTPQPLMAKVDLLAEDNMISSKFYDGSVLDITLLEKRLKLPVKKGRTGDVDLILAGKYLKDFYIDPNKKMDVKAPEVLTSQLDERMIRNVDEKVCAIDAQIKLLSYINPRNLAEQKALFLANPEFSPRFFYRDCELDLEQMRRDLRRIPEVDHPLYPLYRKKITEVEAKIGLIESVGGGDFEDFSKQLFGPVSDHTYRLAMDFLNTHSKDLPDDDSPVLEMKPALEVLEQFLKDHKLSHWSVKVIEDGVVDIQVTKRHVILVKKDATFQENRLKALLVHEIGTHVFRFENGKRQPFRILERGTAGYLRTEEGLAVWNQNQLGLDLGYKFLSAAYHIVTIHMARKMSFHDLFHYLKNTYDLDDEMAWKHCVKAKRGLKDTADPGAFTKDALYFLGHRDIEKFISKGGDVHDLYVGKIAVDDLKLVQGIEGLKPAKFVL